MRRASTRSTAIKPLAHATLPAKESHLQYSTGLSLGRLWHCPRATQETKMLSKYMTREQRGLKPKRLPSTRFEGSSLQMMGLQNAMPIWGLWLWHVKSEFEGLGLGRPVPKTEGIRSAFRTAVASKTADYNHKALLALCPTLYMTCQPCNPKA